MKRILNIAAITAMLVLTASLRNTAVAQDDDYYDDGYYGNENQGEVSYQTFYDELSPHGRWVDNPQYGYVWVPNLGRDFRPYSTNGHWVWTDNYEWMWVSNYSWGWAPFHYGRWDYDPFYGWVWIPGYEWSPAWVAWRSGGDYYGWAPIRPGISISINFGFGNYNPPYDYWCFAPRRYITSPRIYDHFYDRSRNITIINQTTIINNYNYRDRIWRTGPSRYDAERYAGRITPVRFRESSRPGRTQFRNNEVSVYRPRVQQDNTRRFTPRNVERYDRQAGNNNSGVVRNDNRTERNSGRIDRTENTRRNDAATRGNGNNLPRRERTADQNNDRVRTQEQPRQFERRNAERNNEIVNQQRRDVRMREQMERRQQAPQQPSQRQIERRNEQRSMDAPVQQRREMRSQSAERPQQMERRQQQPQQRQIERRSVERTQSAERPQQMERRQQQAQPQEQRRNDGGGNGGGNGNGNGNGKGRNRF